jgi:hypothetical protein
MEWKQLYQVHPPPTLPHTHTHAHTLLAFASRPRFTVYQEAIQDWRAQGRQDSGIPDNNEFQSLRRKHYYNRHQPNKGTYGCCTTCYKAHRGMKLAQTQQVHPPGMKDLCVRCVESGIQEYWQRCDSAADK